MSSLEQWGKGRELVFRTALVTEMVIAGMCGVKVFQAFTLEAPPLAKGLAVGFSFLGLAINSSALFLIEGERRRFRH